MALTVALTLLLAVRGSGKPVTVHIAAAAPAAAPGSGTLRATPDCGSTPCTPDAQAQEVQVRTGETASLELAPGTWRFDAVIPGYWSAEARWSGEEPRHLVLPVWPAGRIVGEVTTEAGMPAPSHLGVRIESPPGSRETARVRTTLTCPLAAGKFTCAVPATALDVRIEAPDAVPYYFWAVPVTPEKPWSAGVLPLRRGASVSGWVTAGRALPAEVHVALTPVAHGGGDETRVDERTHTVEATDRGFFQFRGVPAGTYTIVASSRGWSPGSSEDVTVAERREYEHPSPLMLEPLTDLHVTVQPPRNPAGEPWTLKLDQAIPLSNTYRAIAAGEVTGGTWTHDGLEAGPYRILITDGRGSVFARESITLPRDSVFPVTVSAVAVRGNVTLGDEPLEAGLQFRDQTGKVARFQSDGDGEFTGTLPNEGKWSVRVTPAAGEARIDADPVEVRRAMGEETATVAIRLPGGAVDGTIVDESGRGVPADVAAFRNGRMVGQTASDDSGSFRVTGLPEGEIRLEALFPATDREAAPVTARVNGPAVRIIVRSVRAATGWLTDERGNPVAGALFKYGLADASFEREAVSGPGGEFELLLPPGAIADAVVLAPGFPAKLLSLKVPARAGGRIDIVLSRLAGSLTVKLGNTPPWPWLLGGGTAAALPTLFLPSLGGPPPGLGGAGFTVAIEPGTYRVCGGPRSDDRCVTATVIPGGQTTVDARNVFVPDPTP
ncbi:MAG TPA: carboxypeptidase-like regulatory domain-containing protein [Thermoanaerobaculia bacterium]|nr:carboxypeptidase-like regulatory domain-containing protein [Thermoanaerobaculia bacterium]